eukprot:gene7329-13060_t
MDYVLGELTGLTTLFQSNDFQLHQFLPEVERVLRMFSINFMKSGHTDLPNIGVDDETKWVALENVYPGIMARETVKNMLPHQKEIFLARCCDSYRKAIKEILKRVDISDPVLKAVKDVDRCSIMNGTTSIDTGAVLKSNLPRLSDASLQTIDLQWRSLLVDIDALKSEWKGKTLIEFWKQLSAIDSYKELGQFIIQVTALPQKYFRGWKLEAFPTFPPRNSDIGSSLTNSMKAFQYGYTTHMPRPRSSFECNTAVAAVEGNDQLSSLLSQLSSDFIKLVDEEGSMGVSTATSNEAFNNIESIDFDKESFLVKLREYPSIWDKKHPDYKQRNKCLGNLKKRNACRAKLVALDEELEQDYRKVCFKNQIPVKSKSSSVIIKKTYVSSVDVNIGENEFQHRKRGCVSVSTQTTTVTSHTNSTANVFHGCIYENENDSDGIQKVLKKLHTLVPVYEEDGEKKFGEQGIVGDQLSVERGVNCLLQVSNGFSSEDRFDGIHFEIGDFHAAMKFLQIGFDRFYTGASAADHCTLFADSVLINRRNVGSDVRSRYNPCKQFFLMEVEARLIAAVMELLKMTSIEDIPDKNILQEKLKTETLAKKREFLENLAATVVDSHIMQIDKVANYLASVNLPTKIEANCLLSERAAFRMVWNRFSKTKHGWGGNIPLDLALEHLNRLLKNVLRMLGPNATNQKAVDRYCKALMTRKSLIDLWDKSSSFIKQSGKHTMSCADGDLRKIVKELIECHALRKIPKRRYQYFKRVKSSLIANLDMTSLFAWIEKHKKFIKERKAAR